mmetsp:Transcript_7689/g.9803  ORF Transcript_7689/g.9803 Transcript_7689/m.9803 type:complete len:527 (+) Transcript_7689:155-1735(+)
MTALGATGIPEKKNGVASNTSQSMMLLFMVCTFTSVWYFTSSKNAIASQHLVREYVQLTNSASDGEGDKEKGFTPLSTMIVLTGLQLIAGLCISLPMLFLLSRADKNQQEKKETRIFFSITSYTRNELAVGMLHFVGCLCTNMGFAFGSASIVQVIKLLEPIETLFLTALFNVVVAKVHHGITSTRLLSIFTIVLGTALLFVQQKKSMGQNVNFQSVTFALCSGFAMASRNVLKKLTKKNASSSSSTTLPNNKEEANDAFKTPLNAAVNGLINFSTITAVATIPATLCLILVEIVGSSPNIDGSTITWMMKSMSGREAISYHGLYNIASISVLSLISAQSHSLLNVGKRIFNVISASVVFQEPMDEYGFFGLCMAAVGGVLYTSSTTNKFNCRIVFPFRIQLLLIFVATAFVYIIQWNKLQGFNSFVHVGNGVSTTKPKDVIKSTYEYDKDKNIIDDGERKMNIVTPTYASILRKGLNNNRTLNDTSNDKDKGNKSKRVDFDLFRNVSYQHGSFKNNSKLSSKLLI